MGIRESVRGKLEISSKSEVSSKYVSADENLSNNISSSREEGGILQSSDLRIFSSKELKMATWNFCRSNLLGEGRFGKVFKGHIGKSSLIPCGPGTDMVIAVKILDNKSWLDLDDYWLEEVKYLGRFHHPHIVKLIGYCSEDKQRILVYEFMPRGSLDYYLLRYSSDLQLLSWSIRMKVALGVAKALTFLHSTKINVIDRGFRSSDILLDSEYNAKLSAFGLAIDACGLTIDWPLGYESYVDGGGIAWLQETGGGYAAPEYFDSGRLTAKCNVYGFGVVLLKILCGKRAVDMSQRFGERSLVSWATPYLGTKRKIFFIIDTSLQGKLSIKKAYKVAALALRCVSYDAMLRPNMDEIVAVLDQLQESMS